MRHDYKIYESDATHLIDGLAAIEKAGWDVFHMQVVSADESGRRWVIVARRPRVKVAKSNKKSKSKSKKR